MKEGDYLLSNQEILGGLKAAVGRGESLKDAMMTFYQAGYDKSEIEEAARAYMNEQNSGSQMNVSQRLPTKPQEGVKKEGEENKDNSNALVKKPSVPIKTTQTKPVPKPSVPIAPANNAPKKPSQKISAYGKNEKGNELAGKTLTIALTIVLLVLLGILAAVFLFKDELIVFFNNMFG